MSSLTDRLASFGFTPTKRNGGGGARLDAEQQPSSPSSMSDQAVSVVVRCRPSLYPGDATFALVPEEGLHKVSLKIQHADESDTSSASRMARAAPGPRTFLCSKYCGPTDGQQDIFNAASPIVERIMEGYNGTIFCYGVTGSGKTYTMSGPPEAIGKPVQDPESNGIVHRVSRRIFEYIRDRCSHGEVYSVEASFLEIYSSDGTREQLIDLLSDDTKQLEVKQDPLNRHAFVVDGLRRVGIRTPDEMCDVLRKGQERCTFMETSANCNSSRSHCIFMLSVECLVEQPGMSEPVVQRGKLLLVDLAGSESVKTVQAMSVKDEELRRKQAIGINRVLSSLGTVVNNINKGFSSGHRDSALTMLLRDCLGGNSRALLIATIGPELEGLEESLKTLTFAQQMMSVQNMAKVNRIGQDQSALMQMKQRHADCIRLLEEKTSEAKDEEAEEFKNLKQEMEDLSERMLTKESTEKTLESIQVEQFKKIDAMRDEMAHAMTKELENMRKQSLQDLDTLRQSVEKHVTNLDDTHQTRHVEEHEARLGKMQAELQDASRSQRAIEEEAADLRIRLASAEERSKMLHLRQEELRKDRLNCDEERKSLRQQSEQQWQKLTAVESDTQRYKSEAEVQRAELARLNAARAEDAELARTEHEAWRAREAELQRELTELNRKLEEAKRQTELQALRKETDHREACAQLRLQIERLEAEASTQAEQLRSARHDRTQLEADVDDARRREEAMRLQGSFELKQCQEELEEATGREKELMQMLHEIQEGIISASGSAAPADPLDETF